MSLKNMSKEELEILSYADITQMLLKENKKPMSTAEIFKEICNLFEYDDDYYVNKIGDYYTSLTIDKRFVLLNDKKWDLRDNYPVSSLVEEDEEIDDEVDVFEEDEEIEEEETEDEIFEEEELEDDDNIDDMDGLSIIEEEVEEEE